MHKPDKKNLYCVTCGESFKSSQKLARHIQKWNHARLTNQLLNR